MGRASIIITGANGFLGSFLAVELAKDYKIKSFDIVNNINSNSKFWDIRKPLDKKLNVDYVIHCASKVDNLGNYKDFFDINVTGTQNVIDSINFKKFIYISSSSVYIGSKCIPPYKESYTALDPLNNYSKTKLLAEEIIREKVKEHFILRPRILHGPGKNPLIEKLLETRILGRVLIPADGSAKTSITSLETIATFIEKIILTDSKAFGTYNIADSRNFTIKSLIEGLCTERNLKRPLLLKLLTKQPLRSLINLYGVIIKRRVLIDEYVMQNLTKDSVLDTSKTSNILK